MASLRKISARFRKFARTKADRRALLIEAVLWLLVARLALILVPFPRLARTLGDFVPAADPRVQASRAHAPDGHAAVAAEIGWAVTRAACHVPFEAVCLPQAIAARRMLSRRGVASVLHFGAMKGTKKPLEAHAWLDAAGVEVTGYPIATSFTEIACFV